MLMIRKISLRFDVFGIPDRILKLHCIIYGE